MCDDYTASEADALDYLKDECHRTAFEKGLWDRENALINMHLVMDADRIFSYEKELKHAARNAVIGEKLALIHSEVSELLELYREKKEGCISEKLHGVTNEAEECADIIIRVLDLCGWRNINIGKAVKCKMEYNRTRPHRHGKEF